MSFENQARLSPDRFQGDREEVELALSHICDTLLSEMPLRVAEAIRYALLSGGKRLRAILVLEAGRACGVKEPLHELAAAVEIVHAYSLVHDDLPCMDDDILRRGRPTVHVVYGVSVAMAAGLAMVPLAARCVLKASEKLGLSTSEARAIVHTLMNASGASGMVGGQLMDLEAEGKELSLPELEAIHRNKTGALILASVQIGAQAARASAIQIEALDIFGRALGLAFQIADDVLDVTATSDQLGKTAGKDVAFAKSTYPALLGVEGARARAISVAEEACSALRDGGLLTPALEHLARYTVERRS